VPSHAEAFVVPVDFGPQLVDVQRPAVQGSYEVAPIVQFGVERLKVQTLAIQERAALRLIEGGYPLKDSGSSGLSSLDKARVTVFA
jgi:hypothetical protein